MTKKQAEAINEVISFIDSKAFQSPEIEGGSERYIHMCGIYNQKLRDAKVNESVIHHVEKLFIKHIKNW